MKQNIANSIEKLVKQTGIEAVNVNDALQRMKEKGTLTSTEADIAETIAPFREGDFVCVKTNLHKDAEENDMIVKEFTFDVSRITAINEGKATLAGVIGDVKQELLEAVPIDGVHDKNIYYDPVVGSSGVAPSVDMSIYYMQSFESMRNEDGKTYAEIVKERDYHFVHEIQHWLENEGDYGLKINRR